ncbi:TraB/GumN family protein [Luteimonas sp. 50]|uniref:TraB/GumN family protein n=1 Tax=Cognatiluteimonas sedimenti TaxID=2927791 RepID=A0ABT0A244_9GAMM|nr:TraB/GumN family protein [Lysobacter sedimenti]MCJ0825057.1 TraB/GumN family protein [Lysobacter sedimenti]
MGSRALLLSSCIAALVVAVAHASAPAAAPGPMQDAARAPATQAAEPVAVAAMPAAEAPAAPPVPLLWKVSDADNSVYLLGSFHLLKPGDYPLSADVDAAFADAESLLFEMPPSEMESPTLALQMGHAALRVDGSRLDSQLPPATARKLQDWFTGNAADLQASGLTSQSLQMFEPWFVGLTVSIIEMTREGLDPKLGLDRHFAEAAGRAGKPVDGFETGAQQIAFLDGMDADEQVQFLDEALSESDEGGSEVEKLHAAWRAGDAATLWDDMAADMKRQYPRLYRHVNVERNDAWLPRIEQRLQASGEDDTMVVVGTLHLLGSDGLVEKLRARGYAVERICSACKAAE